MLTHDQIQAFDRDGFVIVEDLFSRAEAGILCDAAHGGERTHRHSSTMPDASGRSSKLALWMDIGDDIFSLVSTHPRVVDNVRLLLREDCYHWHSKVMLKEPRVGGAWEWHQDYGYWYHDGCPYPRLVSCLIALDKADRDNGCLKVLAGSHHLGRIEHGTVGKQNGANQERVHALAKVLEIRYMEAEPGTAVFFHCNTLHASDPNPSDRFRTSYICCYNAMSNIPLIGDGHGKPCPISVSADDALARSASPTGASIDDG